MTDSVSLSMTMLMILLCGDVVVCEPAGSSQSEEKSNESAKKDYSRQRKGRSAKDRAIAEEEQREKMELQWNAKLRSPQYADVKEILAKPPNHHLFSFYLQKAVYADDSFETFAAEMRKIGRQSQAKIGTANREDAAPPQTGTYHRANPKVKVDVDLLHTVLSGPQVPDLDDEQDSSIGTTKQFIVSESEWKAMAERVSDLEQLNGVLMTAVLAHANNCNTGCEPKLRRAIDILNPKWDLMRKMKEDKVRETAQRKRNRIKRERARDDRFCFIFFYPTG